MGNPARYLYAFGDFCLDPNKRVLLRAGATVHLTPKAFDTLLILVSRRGRVVEKDELLKEIWPDTFVEEATLAQNIFTLRKALGQGQHDQRYIETIPKHGYRFIAEVRELPDNDSSGLIIERHTRTHIVAEEVEETDSADDLVAPVYQNGGADGQRTDRQLKAEVASSRSQALSRASFSSFLRTRRQRLVATVAVLATALMLAVIIIILVNLRKDERSGNSSVASFQKMRITMLTNQGNAVRTAVSPDGKYVATALQENARQSLWIRQVTATNNIQVVLPADVLYQGVTFSPDSSSIYYVVYEKENPVATLFQVPVLGGTPKRVIADVDSAISFSPDGKSFAFIRNAQNGSESALMLASTDGTGERKLATRNMPEFFSIEGPAWSPDGKTIICALGKGQANRPLMAIAAVEVADGSQRLITPLRWDFIGQMAWLPDESAILMDAWDSDASLLTRQIWRLSYPGGEVSRVTNDLNSYHGVSLAANSNLLLTVRATRVTNFWVAPWIDINSARQITVGTGDLVGEVMGISWTPDGRLVYGSDASGDLDVWIMDGDGKNRKQLTVSAQPDFKPSVSADGRSIVFVSWRTGQPHLWRMDVDGSHPVQLTFGGNAESYPDLSPDGRWVVYSATEQSKPSLWKLSLEGGEPVQLNQAWSVLPSISPDGKLIACFYDDEQGGSTKIALIPFEGGAPLRLFDCPRTVFARAGLHWTDEGRALAYVDTRGGVSNIWSQPLDGTAAKQVTNFTSGKIFRLALSSDGARLVLERGIELDDVTSISNFR